MTNSHSAYSAWFQTTYKSTPIGGLGSSDYRAFHAGAHWQAAHEQHLLDALKALLARTDEMSRQGAGWWIEQYNARNLIADIETKSHSNGAAQ